VTSWKPRHHGSVIAKAKEELDSCESNINEYCSLDVDGGKPISQMTLGEKEQAFLEALSSFYYEGKPKIADEEFDLLKDELLWSGSKVAILSSNEKKFLEATLAYNAGNPIMTNEEFDNLKNVLRQEGSIVTEQGARCSIRTRKMYSDAKVDYLRMVSLNAPAAITVLFGLFSIDDLTGFEVTQLMELPEPFGIIVVWGLILPMVYVLSNAITNLVFKDALVLKAPCPSCGTDNIAYFGDIFTVSGNREVNTVECSNCKSKLSFNAETRQVVVAEEQQKPKQPAASSS
jgi:hypothetical protein